VCWNQSLLSYPPQTMTGWKEFRQQPIKTVRIIPRVSCAAVGLRIVWLVCGVTPAGHYRPSDPVYPALYSRCNVRTRQTARWIAVDPRQTHVPPSAAAGPVPWGSGQEVALNQDWFYLSSTQGGHAALQSSPNKQHPLSPYTLDRACVWRVHVVCKVSKGQDSAAGTWMPELL
jgi:hypothetical protein